MAHRNFHQEAADRAEKNMRDAGLSEEEIREKLVEYWQRVEQGQRERGRNPFNRAANIVGAGLGPLAPPVLPPVPVPTLDDPEIAAARERQRRAELRRKGRRATMLTGGRGVEEPLGTVNRPQARAATNLGQTGM